MTICLPQGSASAVSQNPAKQRRAVLAQAGTASVQRSADLDQALLSKREREVPRLMTLGWRTKEIAETLGISAKTVETYRARIMKKLRIDTWPAWCAAPSGAG